MKRIIILILLMVSFCEAQTLTKNWFFVPRYKIKFGTVDSSVTIWYNRTNSTLKLIRHYMPDTLTFSFSGGIATGGWTLSGSTPAKIYNDFGKKVHFRNTAGDTTGAALVNFYDDPIGINGLTYTFPSTRFVGSVPFDSLGNGTIVWRHSPSFRDKNETYTGIKTISNSLRFSGSGELALPTADPAGSNGRLWWGGGEVLKYTNASGTNRTLPFGTGTTNELVYWSSANSIGTLPTSTYPNLTELIYVKGVTSSIQTQLGNKQPQLNGTGFVKASGTTLSYDNSTYAPLSGNNTWTGTNTFNNTVSFGASTTFNLPTYNAHPSAGTLHYASGLIKYSNGSDLLTLATTSNLSSYALINQTMHIGTTALAINRASGVLSLAGVSIDGNAATATKLATARTINGISFDGTANITIPTSVDQAANYTWTGLHKWTSALLSSDTTGAYFNSYTATSGADIKGLTSYVYTSSNPTANKIYGGMFNAVGSGTSGGSQSYGIYANASGSNTSYAGYFTAKGTAGDNYAIYADASSGSYNAYAAYFANGLVYINNGFLNVAGKFAVNTNGQITLVNNLGASSYTNRVLMSDGTSYTPTELFDRNNVWTGSVSYTAESVSYNSTIDASGKTVINAGGSGNGTTSTLSNGTNGQIIILINGSSSFTWTLNESGNINLAGSADYVMGQSDTITLVYDNGTSKWLETARSNN